MSSGPAPNANVPPVPSPIVDLMALTVVVQALKQGMDSLAGRSGSPLSRAVTFNDLVSMQLVLPQVAAGSLAPGTTFSSGGAAVPATTAAVTPYVVSGFTGPSTLSASQVVLGHRFPVKVVFPANLAPIAAGLESVAGAYVNATGTPVLNIQRCAAASDPTVGTNWTTVGTITFSAGGHAGALATTGGAALVFAEGDFLRILGPAVADPTLAQIFLTLTGKR